MQWIKRIELVAEYRMAIVVGLFSTGLVILGAGAAFGQTTSTGSGQAYPSRSIRIITAQAGTGSDFDSRMVAQGISPLLGQPVIVDNRGSGSISGEIASKATPDGYNLLVAGATLWVYPLLRKVSYDVERDFLPISQIERSVSIVAVHPSVAAKSVKEFIDLAKAKPGQMNYGSGAVGSSNHLAALLFVSMAGLNIVHVPSKSPATALVEQMSGATQLTVLDSGLVMPHVKSGKLRALAVTSAEPSPLIPGLPTAAATGLPGYQATGITGVFAPAKTPAPIISRLHREIVRALNNPEIKEGFLNSGSETVASSPEQFAAVIKADVARMGKVIKDSGLKLD